jgi:hypothetical protein
MGGWKLRVACVAATATAVVALLPAGGGADVVGPYDFEAYSTGTVRGQDGWGGADCGATIDQAVVANAGFPGAPATFGDQSLRFSNAAVSGCFNDVFTPSTGDEAGESTAANGGMSGGTRQPFFSSEFTIASATGAAQNGLAVQVSPDRGDGARMSYLRLEHTGGQLVLTFYDVQGLSTGETQPCTGCANFVATTVGSYDPTIPHAIRLSMTFVDGPSNDIVQVFVDGALVHTGGSWEDYYTMDDESAGSPAAYASRTVDSLLIRATGSTFPAGLGQGFLIDAVSVRSGPVPEIEAEPAQVTRPTSSDDLAFTG